MKNVIPYLILSTFFSLVISSGFCQDRKWIMGQWTGFHFVDKAYSPYYIDQLEVTKINDKYFYGISHVFAPEDSAIKISYKIRGKFFKDHISIKQLEIIKATNRNVKIKWPNTCTGCKPIEYSITKTSDSIILTGERNFCDPYCNGRYKLSKSISSPGFTKNNYDVIKDSTKNQPTDTQYEDAQMMKREVKKIFTLVVNTDTAEVRLMDSGIIDDDTATMIFNGRPIANNIRLTSHPLIYKIVLLKNQPNYLILLAKNVGSIPPNTAFVEIRYGGNIYSTHLASDFKTSSSIEIIYKMK